MTRVIEADRGQALLCRQRIHFDGLGPGHIGAVATEPDECRPVCIRSETRDHRDLARRFRSSDGDRGLSEDVGPVGHRVLLLSKAVKHIREVRDNR